MRYGLRKQNNFEMSRGIVVPVYEKISDPSNRSSATDIGKKIVIIYYDCEKVNENH